MKQIFSLLVILLFLSQIAIGQTSKPITFDVCEVEPATEPIGQETEASKVLQQVLMHDFHNNPKNNQAQNAEPVILSSSVTDNEKLIFAYTNPFMSAIYTAYAQHRPLVISPDMVWLMIAQGLTIHIKENSEELRYVFVDHAGQINLDVKRSAYLPNNRAFWEGIFPDFSKAIAQNTKEEVWTLVSPKFSTTSMVEKAAFEITLMDAMSPYFTYSISIICGIPSITLEGEYEDWVEIEKRIEVLKKYGLDWWTDDLEAIIKEFKLASQGKENTDFWKDIFAEHQKFIGCGSEPYYDGWSFKLFPYLKGVDDKGETTYFKNPLVDINKKELHASNARIEMNNLPNGISKAKVLLNDNGAMTMLNFNAGFVGYTQDKETFALRPSIQWFVVDTKCPPTSEELAKYEKSKP